ncbi:FAD-dependent thymidylate synthase [Simkania negevensis]|uniref:FAD-dependent thymidylate synthase n=1 Tax=Simkania negevensis TaxID=83561 RepID=A0ABS3ARK7_9BACT|nr:FAD-dependent thymidylate synthase [Simkania negevensis]
MVMLEHEEFTEDQEKVLSRYVTNTTGSIFVLRNLPEVIKGALFSRYSRSSLGLRSLLLKDFILNEETGFDVIVGEQSSSEEQLLAIKKAQNFYDRILDGYGDDSIGELGGAHLAVENISMLAAKFIEDCRIGGSPLEKSTRYIYFDQKIKGEYLYYREPILMTSAYRDLYLATCNMLFETYSKLIPPLTEKFEQAYPKTEEISKVAYTASIRAKVLDCLRGLLPAGTLTNMGVFGNGRFFEGLIRKLHCANLAELQEIGCDAFTELSKTIPSFVRRASSSHKNQITYAQFHETMDTQLHLIAAKHDKVSCGHTHPGVRLVDYDAGSVAKVAAGLLFAETNYGLEELQQYCRRLSHEEIAKIFDAASSARESRRDKSPRALEHGQFTFEIVTDFGIYRDLQRHRILTQQRQILGCKYGYSLPEEIKGTELGKEYCHALEEAKKRHDTMATEFPEEAQYVVPMAYNVRWYFHVNLRSLQWLCELRSTPAGHPQYRLVAQEMARQAIEACPLFECFLKFVNFEGHSLGRLEQEQKKAEKALR